MKKESKSRRVFLVFLLAAGIIILGFCWFVSRNTDSVAVPNETPPGMTSQEWIESSSATEPATVTAKTETTSPPSSAPEETSAEEYPKIIETETEHEVDVKFTPSQKQKEPTPPAPEGKTIIEDPGPQHPIIPAPEVTAPSTEAETAGAPAA